jgi:hypothetical protein
MAKPTLLEIVQDILSDADSDNVNSLSDTVESTQCARVVIDSFDHIVDTFDLKHQTKTVQLDATSAGTPAQMTRPAGLHSIQWIKYDQRILATDDPKYNYLTYMTPERFLELTDARTSSDSTVSTLTLDSGHDILIRNDQAPTNWTVMNGYDDIIFDSYDVALETNLQQSKSLAYGDIKPTLTLADGSIPDLSEELFSTLKNDARAYFFDIYKDGVTKKIDERDRRSTVRAQRKRHITKLEANQTGPSYGRRK